MDLSVIFAAKEGDVATTFRGPSPGDPTPVQVVDPGLELQEGIDIVLGAGKGVELADCAKGQCRYVAAADGNVPTGRTGLLMVTGATRASCRPLKRQVDPGPILAKARQTEEIINEHLAATVTPYIPHLAKTTAPTTTNTGRVSTEQPRSFSGIHQLAVLAGYQVRPCVGDVARRGCGRYLLPFERAGSLHLRVGVERSARTIRVARGSMRPRLCPAPERSAGAEVSRRGHTPP